MIFKRHLFFIVIFMFVLQVGIAQEATSNIRPKIQNIVSALKNEKVLHLGYSMGPVGLPETNNEYYLLYQQLGKDATTDELVLLTNDSSKTITLYSFLILYSRNYNGLKELFVKNISDSSEVWIASGCTGVVDRVNTFMLHKLNPAFQDSKLPYLTQEEYDSYFEKLVGKDKGKYTKFNPQQIKL